MALQEMLQVVGIWVEDVGFDDVFVVEDGVFCLGVAYIDGENLVHFYEKSGCKGSKKFGVWSLKFEVFLISVVVSRHSLAVVIL